MAKFNYKARDASGTLVQGVAEASNLAGAAAILKERSLLPVAITPSKQGVNLEELFEGLQGISIQDKAAFTRQLATMMGAGLPLTQTMVILENQVSSKRLQQIIVAARQEVEAGTPLSSAFSKYPDTFSPVYIALLRAGEASGSMDKTMNRLADQMEQERDFKGKIRGALLYPAIVLSLMVIVVILMMILVIPNIAGVYTGLHADLPLPTQILINMSGFVQATYLFYPIVVAAIFFGYQFYRKTPGGARTLSDIGYRLPVFGDLNRNVTFALMVKTFGSLVGSGIPILDALKITRDTVGTNIYGDALDDAAKQVERGVRLSIPLQQDKNFPKIIGQMVAIGEETGQLDDVLIKLSKYFEEETGQRIKNLTTALEPIMIVIMGVGVAGLALAILLPMYNLVNVIK